MADPKDIDSCFTLEIQSDAMSSDDLTRVVVAFNGILKAMAESVPRKEDPSGWIVRPNTGSIRLAADLPDGVRAGYGADVQKLFEEIVRGKPVSPYYEDVLKHVGTLSRTPAEINFWSGRTCVSVTRELHRTMQSALRSPYKIPGTVEGRLSTLSEQTGLAIYEPIWNLRIECSVPEEKLDSMRELWRKRVTARGVVTYKGDGYPARIEADDVEAFPDDSELPSYLDVKGILSEGEVNGA